MNDQVVQQSPAMPQMPPLGFPNFTGMPLGQQDQILQQLQAMNTRMEKFEQEIAPTAKRAVSKEQQVSQLEALDRAKKAEEKKLRLYMEFGGMLFLILGWPMIMKLGTIHVEEIATIKVRSESEAEYNAGLINLAQKEFGWFANTKVGQKCLQDLVAAYIGMKQSPT